MGACSGVSGLAQTVGDRMQESRAPQFPVNTGCFLFSVACMVAHMMSQR